MSGATGSVIAVHRGECEVVRGGEVVALRWGGRRPGAASDLAIGDEVAFDPARRVVLDVLPRRTKLARRRLRESGREHVLVANADRLVIVASVADPPFRPGAVDRFMLAAFAGGLAPILAVNKIDLLDGEPPGEIAAYAEVLPLYWVCATRGDGLDALRPALRGARSVLAGHSGVGKSSLLNALQPESRLATGRVTRHGRGRHTTARSEWVVLEPGSVVIDTPGVRSIAGAPGAIELIDRVYPDVARHAVRCRFRDCAHGAEPGCAVRAAVEAGELSSARLRARRRLAADP